MADPLTQIPLDNDHEYIYRAQQKNAATGDLENAEGVTGLKAWFSLTDQGPTIHVALEKALVARTQKLHEYFAVVDGDVLRTHLLAHVGKVGYEVFGDGTNVMSSHPVRFVATRRI